MATHLMSPVSYRSFAQYVAVPGPRRVGLARELTQQVTAGYNPMRDHYGALRRAVQLGTVKGGLTERLALAVDNATGSRAATYPRLAENYLGWYERTGLAGAVAERTPARTWPADSLVRVNPLFVAHHADGTGLLVTAHWNVAPLAAEAVTALLRLAQLAYADQPELTPVLFDAHRGEHHTPGEPDPDYDEWLLTEAGSFTALLDRLADTA